MSEKMPPDAPARAERVEWDGVPRGPHVSGWHWLEFAGGQGPRPFRWDARHRSWDWQNGAPDLMGRRYLYHGPVAPPTTTPPNPEPDAGEVERLRAEVEEWRWRLATTVGEQMVLRNALQGMLAHSYVADVPDEDKPPEDIAAESAARAALAPSDGRR